MSERHRDGRFPIVTALFVAIEAILLAALAYSIGQSHAERQFRAEHNSAQYSASADERIALACSDVQSVFLIECIREEVQSTEEHRRSEYDLSAQQDMADYAFWLMWISIATVAVTALGVWYVRATLVQANETNKAALSAATAANQANKIMAEGQRPWVEVAISATGPLTYEERSSSIMINFNVEMVNKGQTPATGLSIEGEMRIIKASAAGGIGGEDDFGDLRKSVLDRAFRSSGKGPFPSVVFQGSPKINQSRYVHARIPKDGLSDEDFFGLVAVITVTYKTTGGYGGAILSDVVLSNANIAVFPFTLNSIKNRDHKGRLAGQACVHF